MKISEKEKIMISVLGIVALGAGYYYLGYKPQVAKIEAKTVEADALLEDQSKKQAEIAMTEKNRDDIKKLNFSIEDGSAKIYPDIWQPKLIKELDDLGTKANIDVTFGYSKEVYAPISEYFTSKAEEAVMANTLESLIDEYNASGIKEPIEYKRINGEKVETPKAKEGEAKEPSTLNVKQMKVSATFKGKYENVMKFVKLLEDYKYRIAVPNISIAPSGNNEVSGSLNMEFYSAPRLNDDFDGYYDWKAESTKGKDNPFEDSYTSIDSIENEDAEATSMNVTLRPFNSDMPSVTVGRPDDSTGRTKLIADENQVEEVTIEFTQKGDVYFVKYQMGSDVYPKSGDGIDFIPKGDIKVAVNSEKRSGADDMVSIKLKVKNTTDKAVRVEIKGDDKDNPRVKISTHGDVEYLSN
ncbi:hypothetical protein [uncultured Clostridium sp.]|uniref:hypothetical protein n=1 Tax=uncultured Clostridium sp. TaxID=59620 RepID=UPI002606C743|nr:hypothetical protein [uncultured Clostridium sp.]